jgi:hypothetical protein
LELLRQSVKWAKLQRLPALVRLHYYKVTHEVRLHVPPLGVDAFPVKC